MANNCEYSMKIVGSKWARDKFMKKLMDYDEKNHFFRIFSAYPTDVDGEDATLIYGDCAWSIETCCRAGGYSKGVDLLEVNTRDLKLKLEVFSTEPGCGFQEHYIYDNGEMVESSFNDHYEQVCWDGTEEDRQYIMSSYGHLIGDGELPNDENPLIVGAMENYEEWSI